MTIYRATISGSDKPRFVKAKGLREAQDHFVALKALTADEVEELVGGDAIVERIGQAPKADNPPDDNSAG